MLEAHPEQPTSQLGRVRSAVSLLLACEGGSVFRGTKKESPENVAHYPREGSVKSMHLGGVSVRPAKIAV